jgi:hypothetical protein
MVANLFEKPGEPTHQDLASAFGFLDGPASGSGDE